MLGLVEMLLRMHSLSRLQYCGQGVSGSGRFAVQLWKFARVGPSLPTKDTPEVVPLQTFTTLCAKGLVRFTKKPPDVLTFFVEGAFKVGLMHKGPDRAAQKVLQHA